MNAKAFSSVLAAVVSVATLAVADTHYVSVNSPTPVAPYTNWATAANVIQDAVDAAADGDRILVSSGVYSAGGRAIDGVMTNRVAVDRAVSLESLMGLELTTIQGHQPLTNFTGDGAVRCVYLADGASISGFTLTTGATHTSGGRVPDEGGGGVYCQSSNAVVRDCLIEENVSHGYGGGAHSGTLYDCTLKGNAARAGGGAAFSALHNCELVGNVATNGGGGVLGSILTSCTVVGNTAAVAGGAAGGIGDPVILQNCIVYFNSASSYPNHIDADTRHTCTTPISFGEGSITNPPLFIDTNDWTDLRLQSNSPCINAGNNTYVTTTNDLDGNARISGGTVDMGAYEVQSPASAISYAWLQQYGLPTDGSVDDVDGDGDQATTWQEWKMWTIPTSALSVLKMLPFTLTTNGAVVRWQSVYGHNYSLERADAGMSSFSVLESNIAGWGGGGAGSTAFIDTTATNGNVFLYRVSVPE